MKQKWSAAALLALVLVLVFGNVALAQSKTLYWQRFDADITVQLNGDMRIVETSGAGLHQRDVPFWPGGYPDQSPDRHIGRSGK